MNKSYLPFASAYATQNYLPAEEGILMAADSDFDYWYVDLSVHNDFVRNWDEQRIDNLKNLVAAHSVSPIFHGNYKIPLSSDVEELRQIAVSYVKREVELSGQFGSSLILHGSAIIEPRNVSFAKKQAMNNLLKSLKELVEYANQCNTEVWIENLSHYPDYRPFHYIFCCEEEYDFIFGSLDIPFFFDIGHANVNAKAPVERLITKYSNRIAGMSLSNNYGNKDQHYGIERGTLNYNGIIQVIIEAGWKGIIAFETREKSPAGSLNELKTVYSTVCNENKWVFA